HRMTSKGTNTHVIGNKWQIKGTRVSPGGPHAAYDHQTRHYAENTTLNDMANRAARNRTATVPDQAQPLVHHKIELLQPDTHEQDQMEYWQTVNTLIRRLWKVAQATDWEGELAARV